MVRYMISYFQNANPILLSLLAGIFTFLITSMGAAVVFFFRSLSKTILDSMLSIAAGIMLAAAFFSLLEPAIELAYTFHQPAWFIVFTGFILGGFFLFLGDKVLDRWIASSKSSLKRSILLFSSITLHNIPEGLVLGVAFGSAFLGASSSFFSALTLTLGIAIQNFPEGSAISLPLLRDGVPPTKAFWVGSISGIVEPISAIIGAILVLKIQRLLPFILSLTAGAMIFVTVMELIPESQNTPKKGFMALFLMFGFSLMMILELVLA